MIKTLFETALTENRDTDIEGVGTFRQESDGKLFKWVKNVSTSVALAVGQPVFYDQSLASTPVAMFQGVLQLATTNDISLFAGIAMSAIPYLEYGWIQVAGVSLTAIWLNSCSNDIPVGAKLFIVSTSATQALSWEADVAVMGAGPAIALVSVASGESAGTARATMLNCIR